MIEVIGYAAATLSTIAFLPQVIQTIKTQRTKDISLGMYTIIVLASICWIYYGITKNAPPIYLTNICVFVLSAIVLALKVKNG